MKKSSNTAAIFLVILAAGAALYFNRTQPQEVKASAPITFKAWSALDIKSAAELVSEIYKVTFESELKDQKLILQYADAITQGASLEGVYNGFAHSGFYRELEKKNPGPVAHSALEYFSQELFLVENEVQEKTYFSEKNAGPLSHSMGYAELELSATKDMAPAAEHSLVQQSASDFANIFKNSSVFTLKRVLSDEVLKQIAVLSKDPIALANWYARFAARHAQYKVDFGVGLRNQSDEAFHKSWAQAAPQDRLTWEVINRIHRVLNANKR